MLRTDDVHFRESAGTKPVILKVVLVMGATFSGIITMGQFLCAIFFLSQGGGGGGVKTASIIVYVRNASWFCMKTRLHRRPEARLVQDVPLLELHSQVPPLGERFPGLLEVTDETPDLVLTRSRQTRDSRTRDHETDRHTEAEGHARGALCVCMVITYSKSKDQPG